MNNTTLLERFSHSKKLVKQLREISTPSYVYDFDAIRFNYTKFIESLPQQAKNGMRYAVKANSNFSLLKLLASEGCGADVVSGGELKKCIAAGFSPKKIVFSGVGKTDTELSLAIRFGIGAVQVESVEELLRLEEIASKILKKTDPKVGVGLRLNPVLKVKTHKNIHTSDRHSKFGLDDRATIETLKVLKKSKNLVTLGISAHIGSQIIDLKEFERLFVYLRKRAIDVEAGLGYRLAYVSVGGGLGVSYRDEKPPSFSEYGRLLGRVFEGFDGEILLEMGRALVAPFGAFLSEVVYTKVQNGKSMAIITGGMHSFLRPALYGAYHRIGILGSRIDSVRLELKRKKNTLRYTVVGPICESSDVFLEDAPFEKRLTAGDRVVIYDTGAYGFSMASHYNVRGLPEEYAIIDHKLILVGRMQQEEQLWEREINL